MTAFFVCFLIDNICRYVSWATRCSELPVTLMRLQLLGLIRTYLHHYIDSQLNFLNNSFKNFFVLTYVKIDPEMSTDFWCFFVQGNLWPILVTPNCDTISFQQINYCGSSSHHCHHIIITNRLYVTKIIIVVL